MKATLTRRSFVQLGSAALAVSTVAAWPRSARSHNAGATNIQIVDTGHGTNEAFLRPLADNGVNTIFRYYAQENNIPGKNITPRERDMIFDHGLALAIVYQHQAYRPGRFTTETGVRDANFCLERAAEIRQPQGTGIFFGVDSDTHTDASVIEYLTAVRQVLGGRYMIGCYGSGAHCAAALNAGLVSMTWVAEAPAWGGTREFINSSAWTIYQNKTQIEDSAIMSAGGVPIDTNILNPRFDTIGAFNRDGHMILYDQAWTQLSYDRRKFVTATELNIRDRPNGSVIAHMCVSRTVHVLSVADEWALVDTDEDGQADGYCSSAFLAPLHQMPAYVSGCRPLAI